MTNSATTTPLNIAGYDANVDDNEELGAVDIDSSKVATPGGRSNIIKELPGPESPLVFKIIPQKRANGKMEGYLALTLHTHLVGDGDPKNKKNFRSHLCQKSSGQAQCSECDRYYDLLNKMKELEKAGKKGMPEYLRLKAQSELIQPSSKGWLLVVLPDSPEVKAIRVGKDVLNQLFGKPATKTKAAVESVVQNMIANGNSPYDLKSNTGWISAYKEGEGMGTKYTVRPAMMKAEATIAGRKTMVDVPAENPVHQGILKLKRSDLPNLAKIEERNVWKKEDSDYYAANLRVPQHILEDARNGGQGVHEEDEAPIDASAIPTASAMPVSAEAAAGLEAIDSML